MTWNMYEIKVSDIGKGPPVEEKEDKKQGKGCTTFLTSK